MDTKFYQACFTRVEAAGIAAGWQTVNVSPNITQSMFSFFESNEKSNEVRNNAVDDDGNPIRFTKIISDARNVGITQVQFDHQGRALFFSHGYVTDDSYEVLKKPERVLCISDDNFRFTVEETKEIREELIRVGQLSECEILDKYGLTGDLCLKFIKCAMHPIISQTQTTLFVKTDGSREMAMDLLYLIYRSLPYSLRSRVTASTYVRTSGVNSMFVFTNKIPSMGSYVDPVSGENNVINEGFEKRLERNSYLLSYAKQMPVSDDKHDAYYGSYEKILSDMGDIRINRLESLKLAYMTLTKEDVPEQHVAGIVYDWLNLPVPSNENVIAHINKFINMAIQKNVDLSGNSLTLLQNRIRESKSQILFNAFINYKASWLIRIGSNGFDEIDNIKKNDKIFNCILDQLKSSEAGLSLLNAYYLDRAAKLTEKRTCYYNYMIDFLNECSYIADVQKVRNMFLAKSREIVFDEQRKGKPILSTYALYIQSVQTIDTAVKVSLDELADEYDVSFRKNYDDSKIKEYESFYGKFNRYPWANDFLHVRREISNGRFSVVTDYLNKKCSLGNYQLEREDAKMFAERLLEFALQKDAARLCTDMRFWYAFSVVLNCDLAEMMAKKHVSVLCDPEVLDESMSNDSFWRSLDNLEYVYEGCKRYCEQNKEQDILTKYTLSIIKDEIVAVKKSIKEDEKKKKREEKGEGSVSFGEKLQSIFKGKKHFEDDFDNDFDRTSKKDTIPNDSRENKRRNIFKK